MMIGYSDWLYDCGTGYTYSVASLITKTEQEFMVLCMPNVTH